MICAIRAFLEFCFIVCRNIITDATLSELKDAFEHFHEHRKIFEEVSVQLESFSLPRQHSLCHYELLICLFGAPNGLCTSVTESKHITAIKKPWCHSNKHNAVRQILRTNQHLSQLAAARTDFEVQEMLPASVSHLGCASTQNGEALSHPEPLANLFSHSKKKTE